MENTEWIAPSIAGVIAIITALIAGGFALRNRKRGALEQRAPDVTEAWAETNVARRRGFWYEDHYHETRGGWKNYARRMLEKDETNVLTDSERAILETTPPSDESFKK